MIIKPGTTRSLAKSSAYFRHGKKKEEKQRREEMGEEYVQKGTLVLTENLSHNEDTIVLEMIENINSHSDKRDLIDSGKMKNIGFIPIVSFSPEDEVSAVELEDILRGYAKHMGFEKHQYAVWKHEDKEHTHYHFLVNRISTEGETFDNHESLKRGMVYSEQVEKKYPKLKKVNRSIVNGAKPQSREEKRKQPIKKITNKRLLEYRKYIDWAVLNSKNLTEVKEKLETKRIKVIAGYGLAFYDMDNGMKISKEDLGEQYSRKSILEVLANNSSYRPQSLHYRNKPSVGVRQDARHSGYSKLIDKILEDTSNFNNFKKRLEVNGIEIKAGFGMVFKDIANNYEFNYEKLGKNYTKTEILKRLANNKNRILKVKDVSSNLRLLSYKIQLDDAMRNSKDYVNFLNKMSVHGISINSEGAFFDEYNNTLFSDKDLGTNYKISSIKDYFKNKQASIVEEEKASPTQEKEAKTQKESSAKESKPKFEPKPKFEGESYAYVLKDRGKDKPAPIKIEPNEYKGHQQDVSSGGGGQDIDDNISGKGMKIYETFDEAEARRKRKGKKR